MPKLTADHEEGGAFTNIETAGSDEQGDLS